MPSLREAKTRAIEWEELGCYVAAMIVLERVVQLAPDDAFSWLTLSECYKAMGKLSECRGALEASLRHCPPKRRWIVIARLAILENKQGRFDEAEPFFKKAALEADDDSKEWIAVLRGSNLLAKQDFPSAERVIRSLLDEQKELENRDEALNVLGLALLGQNRLNEARETFLAAAAAGGIEPSKDRAAISTLHLDEAWAIADSIVRGSTDSECG